MITVGVLLVSAALSFSGTDLSLGDFETQGDARHFVSEHLPVRLSDGVQVEQLSYQRFTDWRLEAVLRFESPDGADKYLERVRGARQLDANYCFHDATMEGAYFLAKWHACGELERQPGTRVRVQCHTR